jgi:hypothetical protein
MDGVPDACAVEPFVQRCAGRGKARKEVLAQRLAVADQRIAAFLFTEKVAAVEGEVALLDGQHLHAQHLAPRLGEPFDQRDPAFVEAIAEEEYQIMRTDPFPQRR